MQITQIWDYYSFINARYTVISVIFHSRPLLLSFTYESLQWYSLFSADSCSIFSYFIFFFPAFATSPFHAMQFVLLVSGVFIPRFESISLAFHYKLKLHFSETEEDEKWKRESISRFGTTNEKTHSYLDSIVFFSFFQFRHNGEATKNLWNSYHILCLVHSHLLEFCYNFIQNHSSKFNWIEVQWITKQLPIKAPT